MTLKSIPEIAKLLRLATSTVRVYARHHNIKPLKTQRKIISLTAGQFPRSVSIQLYDVDMLQSVLPAPRKRILK